MDINTFFIFLGFILALTAVVAFVLWRIRVNADFDRCLDMIFLNIAIPINDSKEDKERSTEAIGSTSTFREVMDVMTHFYESIASLYTGYVKNKFIGETFFSCEMVVLDGELKFYCVIPRRRPSRRARK